MDLSSYYVALFSMVQHHKYSIAELENLIPFERDIYMNMLLEYLKEVEEEERKKKR